MQLDHLAIAAATLDEGVAMVEAAFGVTLAPGGTHAAMGTHNRLLSLGPNLYLEVIAIDPTAHKPDRPRWFDLDHFTGPPRLTNWILGCADLDRALEIAPPGTGSIMDLRRGDLDWRITIPDSGILPFDGIAPALIQWTGTAHPAARLPDAGCRLRMLTVRHPDADALAGHFPGLPDVRFATGPEPGLQAVFDTPRGLVTL